MLLNFTAENQKDLRRLSTEFMAQSSLKKSSLSFYSEGGKGADGEGAGKGRVSPEVMLLTEERKEGEVEGESEAFDSTKQEGGSESSKMIVRGLVGSGCRI